VRSRGAPAPVTVALRAQLALGLFGLRSTPTAAPARREPISGVPDYNAVVEVVPLG